MVDASLDGWLTAGRYNMEFERRLSKFLGVKHVLTVNSGSSANLIAFSCLTSPKLGARAIKPGDEVISVAAGSNNCNFILQFGAVPVFIDVTLKPTISTPKIESAITPKKGHNVVTPGNRSTSKSSHLCEKYNLWLGEDTCNVGSTYRGKSWNIHRYVELYPAHHITMGEAPCSDSDELGYLPSYRLG